jgi:hypothetical protein
VLNARTDPFLRPLGDSDANFSEAVRRANAYLDTGATCAFVRGPTDANTVGRLVKAIHGPLNILAGRAGQASLRLEDLRRLGVRRVSIGGSLMLSNLNLYPKGGFWHPLRTENLATHRARRALGRTGLRAASGLSKAPLTKAQRKLSLMASGSSLTLMDR